MIAAIACYSIPLAAPSGPAPTAPAEIRGTVLAADGLTSVSGASVKAAHLESRKVYSSNPTARDGVYLIAGLPSGTYDLAVETSEGLYAADLLVEAAPGRRNVISFSLRPGAQEEEPPPPPAEEEKKPEEGEQAEGEGEKPAEETKPEPEPKKKKAKGSSFWRSPGGAAILIVGGAAAIGWGVDNALDNDEEPPMTPGGS